MLSLTEKPDNLLMWAHYADSHRGFIIGMDAEHSFFDQRSNERDRVRAVREVQYLEDRPSFEGLDLEGDEKRQIEQLASMFFFTKSDHWRYESEWRMLMDVEDAEAALSEPDDTIYLFPLPAATITSIIFGCQTFGALRAKVWRIVQENERYDHVELYQARMDPERFRLNVAPLDEED